MGIIRAMSALAWAIVIPGLKPGDALIGETPPGPSGCAIETGRKDQFASALTIRNPRGMTPTISSGARSTMMRATDH